MNYPPIEQKDAVLSWAGLRKEYRYSHDKLKEWQEKLERTCLQNMRCFSSDVLLTLTL